MKIQFSSSELSLQTVGWGFLLDAAAFPVGMCYPSRVLLPLALSSQKTAGRSWILTSPMEGKATGAIPTFFLEKSLKLRINNF